MRRPAVFPRLISSSLLLCAAAFLSASPVSAQDLAGDEHRFIQIFIEDAAIVENGWVEGQFRWQDLDQFDSRISFGPVVAFSPVDRLEVGGRFDFVNLDFGRDSESGISDTTVYGKWQIFRNPIEFTIGGELSLPTGDEDDRLGTGEVDAAIFGAVRKNFDEAYVTGHFGFRANQDADVGSNLGPGLAVNLDGKASVFLGAAVMIPRGDRWAVSGELTVETERYEQTDSAIEFTVGGYWFAGNNLTFRAGVGLGLADASPDLEVVAGIVGHF
ncbi:MAG: hypothetical protein ACE5IK_04265 [Acidobacteriota bacterium]